MIIMENGNLKTGEAMIDYSDFLNLQKINRNSMAIERLKVTLGFNERVLSYAKHDF